MHGIKDPAFLKKNKNYLYNPTSRKAIAGVNAVTASQKGAEATAAKTPQQKAGSCEAADSRNVWLLADLYIKPSASGCQIWQFGIFERILLGTELT